MARKAEPVKRRTSAAASSKGFTLIETLVALAILGVIVGVLVRVHLQTLRAAEFSKLRGQAVLESETILTGALLGDDPKAMIEEAQKQGWKVAVEKAGEPGGPVFTEWRVAVSNSGAPVVVMMLRDATATGRVSKAGP